MLSKVNFEITGLFQNNNNANKLLQRNILVLSSNRNYIDINMRTYHCNKRNVALKLDDLKGDWMINYIDFNENRKSRVLWLESAHNVRYDY